ncbi:MAG: glycosyltransferase family 2 protein [Winogradskyella sp.]|nr:glycosyltransferase family 2 protein [Winogradskyella sp.]
MLSVLIPTYNYNVVSLVEHIHKQCSIHLNSNFEILIYDDCSSDKTIVNQNQTLSALENCDFKVLSKNIGRSAIRNKLAQNAKYDWLLFLDADVMPIESVFISNYIENITEEPSVIYGGILYQELKNIELPSLRWHYGRKREALNHIQRNKNNYLSFLTLNFLIHKSIFNTVKFNEDIPNFRHEDTLFSYNLMQNKIPVKHINNPTYHLGIEDSKTFIKKSLESVEAINLFINTGLIEPEYTRISHTYSTLKKLRLDFIFSNLYKFFNSKFEKNLLSSKPSLFIFDLYRLCYYCYLNRKK